MHPPVPQAIVTRFGTVTEEIPCGSRSWVLLAVDDTNRLVDAITPEEFARDERLPYWAELWTSSIALARTLRERTDLEGRTVLDLGCGLGLTGIAAAQAGARVTMTDYDVDALLFSRWNIDANLTEVERRRTMVRYLDWRDVCDIGFFDVITGADIIYDRAFFPLLLGLFRRHLHPGGEVLLTEPGRAIGRDFRVLAGEEGFSVESTTVTVERKSMQTPIVLSALTLPTPAGQG
jgi:predicted nicotinamide N-methyase